MIPHITLLFASRCCIQERIRPQPPTYLQLIEYIDEIVKCLTPAVTKHKVATDLNQFNLWYWQRQHPKYGRS